MSLSNDVEIVKRALDLTKDISAQERELRRENGRSFKEKPEAPRLKKPIKKNVKKAKLQPKVYPKITPSSKFNWKIALIPFFVSLGLAALPIIGFFGMFLIFPAIAWIAYYFFGIYWKKRKEEIAQIQNSPEHLNQCAAVDAEYSRMEAEAEAVFQRETQEAEALYQEQYAQAEEKYKEQCETYNNETLPKYQKELSEWAKQHEAKIVEIKTILNKCKSELEKLYVDTKIVPIQYRKQEILQHIYEIISTSNFDIAYAIDDYNRNEQKKIEQEKLKVEQKRLYAQQVSNEQAEQYYQDSLEQEREANERMQKDAARARKQDLARQKKADRAEEKRREENRDKIDFSGSPTCAKQRGICAGCPVSVRCSRKH